MPRKSSIKKQPDSTPEVSTAQREARQRKQSITVSMLCYWFVAGISLIAYLRYLLGTSAPITVNPAEFRQILEVVALLMVIGATFTFRWLRIDRIEHGLDGGVRSTLISMAEFFFYLRETRTRRESWHTFFRYLALRAGCVVACYAGTCVAFETFVP
jgi:hypothetical protein